MGSFGSLNLRKISDWRSFSDFKTLTGCRSFSLNWNKLQPATCSLRLFCLLKGTKPGVGYALFHPLKILYKKRHKTKSYNYFRAARSDFSSTLSFTMVNPTGNRTYHEKGESPKWDAFYHNLRYQAVYSCHARFYTRPHNFIIMIREYVWKCGVGIFHLTLREHFREHARDVSMCRMSTITKLIQNVIENYSHTRSTMATLGTVGR